MPTTPQTLRYPYAVCEQSARRANSKFRSHELKCFILARSVEQIISQDVPECGEAIFPSNLLALGVGAAGVRDGNFVDPPVPLRDFGGDFRFEAEAIRLQFDVLLSFRLVKMSESNVRNLLPQ